MSIPSEAYISGSMNLLGQGANMVAQGKTNKKTRLWNEKMYSQQRADALADYTMQNQYNSPTSQMARLKEAGLNPKLIYSNGATHDAAPVRSTEAKQWSPHAPQLDPDSIGNSVAQGYGMVQTQQQTDNLKKQNTLIDQQTILTASQIKNTEADTLSKTANTGYTGYKTKLGESLFNNSLEMADANLNKLYQDTGQTIQNMDINAQRNLREAAQTSSNIKEAIARMLTMESQRASNDAQRQQIQHTIQNLDKDGQLKQLDINLKSKGLQPSDNLGFRVLGQLWEKYEKQFNEGIEKFGKSKYKIPRVNQFR